MTRGWPTSNSDAAEALEKLVPSHTVNPLPAYDQHGIAIEPLFYKSRLDGSTAIIRFSLLHHVIHSKENEQPVDMFSARVYQIRVIRPPASIPVTPRKKKMMPTDDYFGTFTPTKRPRFDDDDDDKESPRPSKVRVIK